MTVAAKRLSEQVLALPKKDRAHLVLLLVKSLDLQDEELEPNEWSKVWKIELDRRLEEIRSGKVKTVPADQVMRDLKAKYL